MRKVAFVISLLLASAASAGPVRVDGGMYLAGSPKAGPLVNTEGLKGLDDYFAWRRR